MMLCFTGECNAFYHFGSWVGYVIVPVGLLQTEKDCRDLYRLTDLAYAVETGKVIPKADAIPEHCKVRA